MYRACPVVYKYTHTHTGRYGGKGRFVCTKNRNLGQDK